MHRLTLLALAAVVLGALAGAQGQDRPDLQLKAAVYKETVEGDLQSAVALYKQIVSNAAVPRPIAAAALLGLGGCYEKLGQQDARRVYERLVAEYADQTQEVAAARARLVALAAGAPARDSRLAIRRVPNVGNMFAFARPSPDGKYLAFLDWSSGNLALLDVATGATKALTKDGSFGNTGGFAQFSAWSRDSSRIACQWVLTGPNGNRPELRIISLGGEKPPETVAIPGATWVIPHDWSPDGSRILCSYGQGPITSGFVLVGAGSGTIDKLDLPQHYWLEYQFTREGDAILYSASPDGKAGPRDVFLRNLKTGVTTPLVQHPAEDLLVGVLPGTDWLFFASDRQGRLDLWAVPFRQGKANGQPVLVKQGLGRLYPLGFTNDGRYYYATLSATDDVFFADFDRESGRVISEARKFASRWDGVSGSPSFSPDGESLAYLVNRNPNPLRMHTADSLVVQSLKKPMADPVVVGFEEFGLEGVTGPCWLPDGKAVVLSGYRNQEQETALYRVDLSGLRKTRIYSPAAGHQVITHACASAAPFIYVRLATPVSGQGTEQRGQVVIRIDLAGGPDREVFQAPQGQGISSVALSPDGRSLSIITRLDRYRRALLVTPSEGGTPRQILEFRQPSGGGVAHVWAPDGRSILYVEGAGNQTYSLRSVRVDGGGAVPETIFKWTGQFFELTFHPNGRLLAFTGRANPSTNSEVWVIENLREELKMLASPAKRP